MTHVSRALDRDRVAHRAQPALQYLDRPWVWRIGGTALTMLVWQAFGTRDPVLLSYPTEIVRSAYDLAYKENLLLPALLTTLEGLAVGFAISAIMGIGLGFLMGRVRLVEVLLKPYVTALYATPRIALVPLLVLWCGIGFQLRVVVVVLSCIFPIAINTYNGTRYVERDYLETARAFAASRMFTFRTVIVPASLPYVFAGLRVGIIRGLIGVIVAEMTASITGTGQLIMSLGDFYQTGRLLVPIMMLGLIGILLMRLTEFAQRRAAPWVFRDGAR